MGRAQGWIQALRGRSPMRSPGPPGARGREERRAFWRWIAEGVPTATAATLSGISEPLGVRWFRAAGGLPPGNVALLSGRYLSFVEREELALLRAAGRGVRAIARRQPSPVSYAGMRRRAEVCRAIEPP